MIAGEDAGAGGGGGAAQGEDVLNADGDAGERAGLVAVLEHGVDALGLGEGAVAGEGEDGVDAGGGLGGGAFGDGVVGGDAGIEALGEGDG